MAEGVSGCGVGETEHREAGRAWMGSSITRPWTWVCPGGIGELEKELGRSNMEASLEEERIR